MKLVPKPAPAPANPDAIVTVGGAALARTESAAQTRAALARKATAMLAHVTTSDERRAAGILLPLERIISKAGGGRATWAYRPTKASR